MSRFPTVCIFGVKDVTLSSSQLQNDYEATDIETHCFDDDSCLEDVLNTINPHVFVSIGSLDSYPTLMSAPFEIRRRWLHYSDLSNIDKIGFEAFWCYIDSSVNKRLELPLVSIITPTYRTGDCFRRAYQSVIQQTYNNWEWIILDDSDDNNETIDKIKSYIHDDHRISLIKNSSHSGVIGEVKYNACMASKGDIIIELDHDDELTSDALATIVQAAEKFPDCGFFYTDCAEVSDTGEALTYPDGWGYGFGKYRWETYNNRSLAVASTPNINAKSIRSLVAAPNHLRAWRRTAYMNIGGHNRLLYIADDMDLMIRMFLTTKIVKIPKLCYIQYHNGNNTQLVRNADIQRHVRYLRATYDRRIHDRLIELGVNDWIWDEDANASNMDVPNLEIEPVASYTYY